MKAVIVLRDAIASSSFFSNHNDSNGTAARNLIEEIAVAASLE